MWKSIGETLNITRESVVRNCPEHGTYTGEDIFQNGRLVSAAPCPECEKQKAALRAELVEAERLENERKQLDNKLIRAGIPEEYRGKGLADYIPQDQTQASAKELTRRFINGWGKAKAGGYGLLFFGACGTGKTHLGCTILQSLIEATTCKYMTVTELFWAVRGAYAKNAEFTEDDVIDRISKIGLLVLDEIGVQKGSDAERRILFSVMDRRLTNKKPTILLTNLPPEALLALLGDRLMDRVSSKCVARQFLGRSMRKPATDAVFM